MYLKSFLCVFEELFYSKETVHKALKERYINLLGLNRLFNLDFLLCSRFLAFNVSLSQSTLKWSNVLNMQQN